MSDEKLKVQPYNLEAEQAVLGCMLIDKVALNAAVESLTERHFFEERNGKLFATIKEMANDGQIVDVVTLADKLRGMGFLEGSGGGAYITHLIDVVPTSAHVMDYIDIVKEKYVLRKILRLCMETMEKAYRQEEAADDVLEFAEQELYNILAESEQDDLKIVSEDLHDQLEQIENIKSKKYKTVGIPTGFPSLDKLTSGLQRGNMVILAARPGMGKTSLAMDIIRQTILNGGTTAFFSLEMTRREIIHRMISSISGVPLFQIKNGFFPDSDWASIHSASEKIYGTQFYLSSSNAHATVNSIRATSRRLASKMIRQKKRLDLIVVDYLQLLRSSTKRFESEQTELADISRMLKGMAVDLDVPVLALAQLNRNTEETGRSGKPRLADLRGSGALEQDSDLVMFIYRPEYHKEKATDEQKAITQLIVAKHRNGACGEIPLFYRNKITSFIERDKKSDTPTDFPRSSEED